jgi:uncharacterized coiled-coil protein SlyX
MFHWIGQKWMVAGAWLKNIFAPYIPVFIAVIDAVAKFQTLLWTIFGMAALGVSIPFLSLSSVILIAIICCLTYACINYYDIKNQAEKKMASLKDVDTAIETAIHPLQEQNAALQKEVETLNSKLYLLRKKLFPEAPSLTASPEKQGLLSP